MIATPAACGRKGDNGSAWKVGPPRGCFDRTTCRDVSLKFCPGDVSSRTVLLRIDRTVVTAGVCAKPVRAHIDNSTKARASTVLQSEVVTAAWVITLLLGTESTRRDDCVGSAPSHRRVDG